jgi:SlyX protein
MANTSDDARIVSLETKLAYLENTVAELDGIVRGQEGRIARLEEENKVLAQKYRELRDETGEEIPNRRPPHY